MLPRVRFVLPLILVALLGFSNPAEIRTRYDLDQRIASLTWTAACRLSNYECPSAKPTVRRSAMLGETGARGAYWSDSTVVWLDQKMRGTQVWLTIFHEQIHYLQVYNTVDAGWNEKLMTCIMEREALDFTNAYALELGRPSLVRALETWRSLYNCNYSKKSHGM